MIAKKKPPKRLKSIDSSVKPKVSERGESIGRTVKKPPTRRRMGPKILRLDAPLPGKPRTSKSPKKTIGSLMSEGMSKGVATNAMKKAAMELAKRRKPSGRISKDDMNRAIDMIKNKKLKGFRKKSKSKFGRPSDGPKPKFGFMKK